MIDWDLNGREDNGGVADRLSREERDGEDEALELEVQVLGIGTGKCQKSGVDGEGKEVAHPHYY
jgi:hypothetical protein